MHWVFIVISTFCLGDLSVSNSWHDPSRQSRGDNFEEVLAQGLQSVADDGGVIGRPRRQILRLRPNRVGQGVLVKHTVGFISDGVEGESELAIKRQSRRQQS